MVPSVTAPGLAYGQSLDTLLLEAAQVEKGQRQAQRSPAAVGGIEMVPPQAPPSPLGPPDAPPADSPRASCLLPLPVRQEETVLSPNLSEPRLLDGPPWENGPRARLSLTGRLRPHRGFHITPRQP